MRRIGWAAGALVALAGVVAYGLLGVGKGRAGDTTLTLTGSSTVAPLAAEIARRYEEAHPGVRIDVQTGGSSRGIADARTGLNDVGMVSRALGPDEADVRAWPIARDGVAMIVHRDNPVLGLTSDQVRAIWTGGVEDWADVGGPPGPIVVVHKAEGRATLDVFLAHFGLKNTEVEPDAIVGDNQQGVLTVAGNPRAVGYVSIGEAEVEAEHGVAIRLLPLDGVEATTESVASGGYPMARPLNLVTAGEVDGLAASFIEFSRSPAVHDLIRAHAFVPIR